ncbi:MAG: HAD hydrolase-like protein [Bacteroidales bacterium]
MNISTIKVIAFDADDTLWVNEPYYQETEQKFCQLLEDFLPHHQVSQELFKTEMENLNLYGFGTKSFMLSMIETATGIAGNSLDNEIISKILNLGKSQLSKQVELLDGVLNVLESLTGRYKLVVATKGDLLDQERKLKNSGLEHYFHHIEIMSDKKENDYQKLINHLDILPENFIMIGNSIKSDILPVLNIGGYGIHVPYHTTWAHEIVDIKIEDPKFCHLEKITDVLKIFDK